MGKFNTRVYKQQWLFQSQPSSRLVLHVIWVIFSCDSSNFLTILWWECIKDWWKKFSWFKSLLRSRDTPNEIAIYATLTRAQAYLFIFNCSINPLVLDLLSLCRIKMQNTWLNWNSNNLSSKLQLHGSSIIKNKSYVKLNNSFKFVFLILYFFYFKLWEFLNWIYLMLTNWPWKMLRYWVTQV